MIFTSTYTYVYIYIFIQINYPLMCLKQPHLAINPQEPTLDQGYLLDPVFAAFPHLRTSMLWKSGSFCLRGKRGEIIWRFQSLAEKLLDFMNNNYQRLGNPFLYMFILFYSFYSHGQFG